MPQTSSALENPQDEETVYRSGAEGGCCSDCGFELVVAFETDEFTVSC